MEKVRKQMFGYIVANMEQLSQENRSRYQSYYCGLCRALGKKHGVISRMTLNYDMTFLALFLSAVYDAPEMFLDQKCKLHPLRKQGYLRSEILDYAADMNIVLSYYNRADDWMDDKSLVSLAEMRMLEKQCQDAEKRHPRQCVVIREKLKELEQIEKENVLIPDIPADCFGDLMEEIFVPFKDSLDEKLRDFGHALGKYIYLLDACMDLDKDLKKQHYNPLIRNRKDEFRDILNMLLADVVSSYQALGIVKDKAIIENILFSGVLLKFELRARKEEKKHDT